MECMIITQTGFSPQSGSDRAQSLRIITNFCSFAGSSHVNQPILHMRNPEKKWADLRARSRQALDLVPASSIKAQNGVRVRTQNLKLYIHATLLTISAHLYGVQLCHPGQP